MKQTTLCYIEKDNAYLMMHRIKKKDDENQGKWVGVGGKFEFGESPEDCVLRETQEETGLTLDKYQYRGLVTFVFHDEGKDSLCEYMHLFTATKFHGEFRQCDEGVLEWLPKEKLMQLPMWTGDRIFLELIDRDDTPFFSLKLCYHGDCLEQAVLNGKELPESVLKGASVMGF